MIWNRQNKKLERDINISTCKHEPKDTVSGDTVTMYLQMRPFPSQPLPPPHLFFFFPNYLLRNPSLSLLGMDYTVPCTDRKYIAVLTFYLKTRIHLCAIETTFSCTLINILMRTKIFFPFFHSTSSEGSEEFSTYTKIYSISLDRVTKYLFTFGR